MRVWKKAGFLRKALPQETRVTLSWGDGERVTSFLPGDRTITHTHVLCKKRYYFLAGLKDALGEPLFSSQPELQRSLRCTVSTLRRNLPGQWAPRLGARVFSTSTAPFLDVAAKARTAAS